MVAEIAAPVADYSERLLALARAAATEFRGTDLYQLQVSLDSTLQRDLGLDSLARVELLHRAEEAFQVELPDAAFASAVTLRDVLAAVMRTAPGAVPVRATARRASAMRRTGPAPDTAMTLIEVLRWQLKHHPTAVGITVLSGEQEQPITYEQLWNDSLAVCGALQARGILASESVALMLPTGLEYFAAFIGVLLCGCIPVPIYPPTEISQLEEHVKRHAKLLANARAVAMLTDPSVQRLGRLLQVQVPGLRRVEEVTGLIAERTQGTVAAMGAHSLALLQYTSGSTGDPKGVTLTHAQLLANIRAMGRALRIEPTDVLVSWLPLYHDMGLIGAWFGSLYFGIPLIIMSPLAFLSRPERWLQAIARYKGTLSGGPNFAYALCASRIRDADIAGLDLSSWRVAFSGSEANQPETLDRFYDRFRSYGLRKEALTPVYGLAECAVGLSFPPLGRGPLIDRVDRDRFTMMGEARPAAQTASSPLLFVSCGLPLPGYQIRIVDANQRELGERQEGRLEFKGPSTTAGYFDNPVATARLIHDGWLDSGDRAYVAHGEVFITGRTKDMVIRRGRHIHPDEIEATVGSLEGIRRGCVAAFGTRAAGAATECLVLMAETGVQDPAALATLSAAVTARVVEVLGEPPDEVLLVPPNAVLKTPSGKIRRAACREAYESGTYRAGRKGLFRQVLSIASGSIGPMLQRAWQSAVGMLFAAYFWSLVCCVGTCIWLLVALVPLRSWSTHLVRVAARGVLAAVHFPLTVLGAENIPPTGSCVIIANHASYLDGLVVLGLLRRNACFVAKRELQDRLIPRLFLRRIGAVFVAREQTLESANCAEDIAAAVRSGQALVVFAEGTFTRAPGLLPFHLGGFLAAATANAPVIPMAIRGTRSALRDGQWFPRRLAITVEVGAPISAPMGVKPFAAALDVRDHARTYIASHCGEPDTLESLRTYIPADFDGAGGGAESSVAS
jgi:acyl carrier protein